MVLRCQILPEKCIACGLCQLLAPEIFDYQDDGIVIFAHDHELRQLEILDSQKEAVIQAYRKCPPRAIQLQEE